MTIEIIVHPLINLKRMGAVNRYWILKRGGELVGCKLVPLLKASHINQN
jgi:hypothetical protein